LSKRKNRVSYQPEQVDQQNELSINTYYNNIRKRQVQLLPKTLNQETYINLLTDPSKLIIFATGPAGTGKTMLAMLAGIKALKDGSVRKIILTRPAVGVDDEKHGFLPGDLNQKMEPWTRPLFDVLSEYYDKKEIARMLDEQIIEISPLAFMRGRTFKNAWIIADEMQNATPNQMKMLLTRLGENSKMVVTGDTKQADRSDPDNGLLDFKALVEGYQRSQYIAGVELTGRDIQRHPAVLEVLKVYREV
jgi:phosphate starvation-inducible PhoH-like protein